MFHFFLLSPSLIFPLLAIAEFIGEADWKQSWSLWTHHLSNQDLRRSLKNVNNMYLNKYYITQKCYCLKIYFFKLKHTQLFF